MNRPLTHALFSIALAGLAVSACGGSDAESDAASAGTSPTTAAAASLPPTTAASTTQPAAPPSPSAPATTAPAVATTAVAGTDGQEFDDPDTCDEAIAYIEGLAAQGLELLEMPQDDALDVMGAMNVVSATCDPDAALAFLQRADIVEFMN